jgi:hypothetical protein
MQIIFGESVLTIGHDAGGIRQRLSLLARSEERQF